MRQVRSLLFAAVLIALYLSAVYLFPVDAANNGFVPLPGSPAANQVPVSNSTTPGDLTWKAVPNSALANSSMTINGTSCTLGGSCAPSGGITGPLFSQTQTVSNSTSGDNTITGTGSGSLTLPANYFSAQGVVLHVFGAGAISTANVPGILVLRLKMGSTVIATGNITLPSAIGLTPWSFNLYVTIRSTGAMGTPFTMGQALMPTSTGALWYCALADNGVNIDTTATQTVSFTAQWGALASGDVISLGNFVLAQI